MNDNKLDHALILITTQYVVGGHVANPDTFKRVASSIPIGST